MTVKKKQPFYKQRRFHLFLMLTPFIVLVFFLNYLPLWSWRFAFYDFRPGLDMTWDRFVGLDNFRTMFNNQFQRQQLIQVLVNTLAMSGLVVITMPLPMFFAIFLSELKFAPFRKVVQTLTTIPNFISWVIVFSVANAAFATGDGFINRFLLQQGLIDRGIPFLSSPNYVWITQIGWYIWKSMGWSAIIFFAAMSSIDTGLYEAAECDGAGRWARIRHITIPGLLPTLFVMFVLNIANFVNFGLEQPLVFQNVMNLRWIQTLDLFIFNQGIVGRNQSMAIAVGIYKTFLSLILVFGANALSKLIRKESVF